MAIANATAPTQPTTPAWNWRGELSLVGAVLRSVPPYLLAILALVAVTLAYQVGGESGVRVGGGYDQPYVQGFHDRETSATQPIPYRWATDRSRILLPGAGARPSTLIITAAPRPDGLARPVQVVVNGIPLASFTPKPGLNDYTFPLRPEQYSYGDLTVDLISDPQLVAGKGSTPVPYGPQITSVRVVAADGGGLVKPPLRPLAAWFVIAPTLFFLLRRLGLRPLVASGIVLAGLALGAWAITAQRLDLALFAPRVAFLLVLAYALLVLTDLVVPRLFARGGVTIAPREWRILQLIFLAVLTLKLGGILYPQLFVIDQPWHNQNFEKVLHGRFLEIYRPTAGGISELPGQWGIQGQIPYPPFLYVFGLPFYLGPLGRDLSINLWSGLLDCSRPLLIFFLACRLGASVRAGLIAAFAMGLTACTFLLHSWGNYPTTISQWCALLFLVLLVARFRDLRRPWVFVGLLALLTVTMLLYTVTAVFIGLLLVVLLAGLAWRGGPDERRQLLPLGGLLVGASLLAFFGYYVQFIGPLLADTLPAFRSGLGQGEALGIARDPFPLYAWKYLGRLAYYGVLVSLLLAPLGIWSLLRGAHDRLAGPLLAAWYAVFALFFLTGTRIDMVDKEIWFIVPAIAICAGIACDTLLRRWNPARLTTAATGLYLAHLTWVGLALWYVRIMISRH